MQTLSELWIYPIKSLGGIALSEAKIEVRGLQYDRRWMLVNEAGRFISQREIPEMALLRTAIDNSQLTVSHKDNPSDTIRIELEMMLEDLEEIGVEIWSDKCKAGVLHKSINDWFSNALGENLRLVLMPETTRRWADGRYAPKGQYVSFADGFPYLLVGQASLDDLNARLEQALPMNRFRPNFVFTGGQPFEEDNWSDFKIGEVPFRGIKPCARCIIPTTNQETALRAAEPLKTLAEYRQFGKKICFGQNVVWMGTGDASIAIGDEIHRAR